MSSKENWEIKWRQSSRCCRLNEGNKKQGSFMGWHQQGMEATELLIWGIVTRDWKIA